MVGGPASNFSLGLGGQTVSTFRPYVNMAGYGHMTRATKLASLEARTDWLVFAELVASRNLPLRHFAEVASKLEQRHRRVKRGAVPWASQHGCWAGSFARRPKR